MPQISSNEKGFKGSTVHGAVFAIKFSPRSAGKSDICTLLVEDDGYWSEKKVTFDEFWLDDLLEVVQYAKGFRGHKKKLEDLINEE